MELEAFKNEQLFYFQCGNLISKLVSKIKSPEEIQLLYDRCLKCNTSIKLIQIIEQITTKNKFEFSEQEQLLLDGILNYRLLSYMNRLMFYKGFLHETQKRQG